MKKVMVKICGLTNDNDIEAVNLYKPDFVGFVLFFPKSKRNLELVEAKRLMKLVNAEIKKVAVVVSPSVEQAMMISDAGFDCIQIHGELNGEIIHNCNIPIIKAFNVSDLDKYSQYTSIENIKGFVFDANEPGSGKTFDWNTLKQLPESDKMVFLSGGLTPDNVRRAIEVVNPDVVDISSGVEYLDKPGKDPEKISNFIRNARN